MSKFWFIAALAVIALFVLVTAASSGDMKCIKANRQGEIVIPQEAKIAEAVLPPGNYVLHSTDKDGKHYVHFVEETKHFEVHPETSLQSFQTHVAEVTCAKENATKPSMSAVFYTEEDGVMRIKKAEIQGEEHIHVF